MTRFTHCKILPVLAALAGAMIAASGATAAESGAGFFKGKRLIYIVATSPGGGFDFYARPARYNEAAAKLAWKRTVAHFKKNLAG